MKSDKETVVDNGLFSSIGEEYFSWSKCEFCFEKLGGTRQDINFKYYSHDTEVYRAAICLKCLVDIAT